MLAMHPKKRVEIIVEAPALHRLLEKLDQAGVTGYTVLPALAGRGLSGAWSGEGLAGEAGRMVQVVSIVDAAKAETVIANVYKVLSRQMGVVTVTDVSVIRADHF